ncbi:MAG: glycosyltransferase, partial [Prevotella micans]|nr:glycosyltransferase [Prevotella micans]
VVWRRKKKALDGNQISFETCSKWLGEQARQSSLLKGQTVTSIPNPIDTEVFKPQNKLMARKMLGLPEKNKIILFVSQRVTDKRKGIDYFIKAIGQLVARHPEMKQNITIAILGSDAEQLAEQLALPTHLLGYVSDIRQIINVYNAADVFVLPSLEDNLPNTIMEAMACGVPCVGFEVGGIPEMIDHRVNGYVARERDTNDLEQGMDWVLNEANYAELSREALQKVHRNYSQQSVAKQYIEVYYQAITKKNKSK